LHDQARLIVPFAIYRDFSSNIISTDETFQRRIGSGTGVGYVPHATMTPMLVGLLLKIGLQLQEERNLYGGVHHNQRSQSMEQ